MDLCLQSVREADREDMDMSMDTTEKALEEEWVCQRQTDVAVKVWWALEDIDRWVGRIRIFVSWNK